MSRRYGSKNITQVEREWIRWLTLVLIDDCGWSVSDVARHVERSRATIINEHRAALADNDLVDRVRNG